MTCDHIRDQLPGMIAGELGPDETSVVRDHLDRCDGCAGDLAELQMTIGTLVAAPLAPSPPSDLEARVFERIGLEPVEALVRSAPLGANPPDDLERRSLDRAGVLTGSPSMVRRALAPSLAAAVVALGFFGMQWRNDAQEMSKQFGPPGESLQQVSFRGPSPFPPGGGAELEIVHYSHDNYGVVVEVHELPICRLNYHYEVWLTGEGDSVQLGSFKVPGKGVYNFPVGLDPMSYDAIEITHEPVDGVPDKNGSVLWEAPLS